MASQNSFDVIMIGAGISGINAAYRVQEGLPDMSYAILEGREELGGTWSLFKYPGIRSDSDLHTFGFSWDPWTEDRAIADASSILKYMKAVAARHGIDKHIKYNHQATKLDWRSDQQHWNIQVSTGEKTTTFYARYIVMCTGYYDYTEPLTANIPGLQNFKGQIIHPQFWPAELDYTDKKVVIIGSGATAVTLLPAMNDKAAKVTMLQRSPGYFFAPPVTEPINMAIKKYLPESWAHQIIRLRFLVLGYLLFLFCRTFPNYSKKMFTDGVAKALPDNIKADPNFIPSYNPWQQRLCITPGGDFFQALRTGKSDVVTGHIEDITSDSIKLKSSDQTIDADIIITATGLKIAFAGHATVSIDGEPLSIGDKFVWKGCMLQDVPNLAFVFGYTNMSWTLGADATARLLVRLIKSVRERGDTSVVPKVGEDDKVREVPFLNLSSTYITSAQEKRILPKGGDTGPWVPRSSYFRDWWNAKFGDLRTGLQYSRVMSD